MLKRLDKMMLTGFVGPFLVSFGIAVFVLVMQFLWLYIDEIAGKGVGILVLFELLGYLSITVFPMALPIAVLIASVMQMGNLAERYELSSMKSSGISLLRIMRGLVFCGLLIAGFSYWCSNVLIPISNLQFRTRLFDIRRQKPALSIEPGVFNDDFRLFTIRVGKKDRDGETISNVMIADRSNVGRLKSNQILSDSGTMYTSADKRFFVMHLINGTQYQEPEPSIGGAQQQQKQKYPFVRTNFKSWTKVWDMKEFELVASDQDNFKQQRSMLDVNQLRKVVDSLARDVDRGRQGFVSEQMYKLDIKPQKPEQKTMSIAAPSVIPGATQATPVLFVPRQQIDKSLNQYTALAETFRAEDRPKLYQEADVQMKSLNANFESISQGVNNRRKEMVKSSYELYSKYSFSIICFVFLFIGAPMGAIIRKGGFGYPILVSIIFFVIFVFLSIMCRKFSDAYILTPFWAAMMPCLTMVPIGAFLTRRAMNDAQLFNVDRIEHFFKMVWARLARKKTATTAA
jgi:lipopolysaccharide export system permease protein